MTEQLIKLELLADNPYQPRTVDVPEDIEKLARSIAADGLLQVPKARKNGHGYQLAFGHSRRKAFEWLAAFDGKIEPERYNHYTCMPVEIVELSDEEMYRHAITENVQRKDLNPIELAKALERYMREFNANSKAAGELFGMNDATARGLVRMLELPEPVQDKLAAGAITQDVARKVHSLQKIATQEVVIKTIETIAKGKSNWDGPMTPDEIIEDVIEDNDNIERFSGGDGKKPKSSDGGWLLDMKNFPNQYLPLLTGHIAVQALNCFQDKPAQKIVLEWADDAEHLPGDSEGLQKYLDKLEKINPDYVARLKHLIDPPACNVCQFHTTIDGAHYCGMKPCFQRKDQAWSFDLLQQASKNLGIAIYNKEADGAYRVLDSYEPKQASLFTKKDKGLRLISTEDIRGNYYQWNFKGVNTSVFYVVATGEAIDKMGNNGKGGGGKLTEKEKAERRAMRLYRQHRYELLWEYTGAAQSLFEGVPIEVLRKICNWHFIGIDDRIPEEHDHPQTGTPAEKLEFQRRALVWRLIVGETSHYTRSDLVVLLDRFHKVTQVKTPKSLMKRAQEWDAEIHELARVSAETPKQKKATK